MTVKAPGRSADVTVKEVSTVYLFPLSLYLTDKKCVFKVNHDFETISICLLFYSFCLAVSLHFLFFDLSPSSSIFVSPHTPLSPSRSPPIHLLCCLLIPMPRKWLLLNSKCRTRDVKKKKHVHFISH